MATYKYFTQAGATFASPLFTIADSFIFDDETITAASLAITGTEDTSPILTVEGTGTAPSGGASGSKAYTLTTFDIKKISSSNFIFADGSKLQIGDGTTGMTGDILANTMVGTDFSDYLDGLLGSDTVTYATALSAVTVDLTATNGIQTTGGSGNDKLLRIENIIGSTYNDSLKGIASSAESVGSTLDGGLGIDTLTGGAGNDTFIVTAGDTVFDGQSTDFDLVKSSADWILGADFENLELLTGALVGVGNQTKNKLTGNSSNNILEGKGNTGTGEDTLIGGDGNDTYIITDGTEVITETNASATQIDLVISSTTVNGLADRVENLRLIGAISGTGNTLSNIIYASSDNNAILNGAAGIDTLSYQFGASKGVTITLNAAAADTTGSGTDASSGMERLIGSNYSDTLTGDAAANTITGGLGNDTLDGGATLGDKLDGGIGNDTYVVGDTLDTITDTAGIDTIKTSVTFSLAALTTIENLTSASSGSSITLTGNSLANVLDSESNNQNDALVGGIGNDTYLIDNSGDAITEALNAGTDTVQTSVTYDLSSASNVENLILNGTGQIKGTGNDLANVITNISAFGDTLEGGAGTDKLVGGSSNDTLDGGSGNDNMTGGTGDDTYIVDATGDTIVEAATGGNDTVNASVSYILGANIETLQLTGTDAGTSADTDPINGTGNSSSNTLLGNAGNNSLTGGLGADTITGGKGNDTYALAEAGSSIDIVVLANTAANNGIDTITGFKTGTDLINLDAATAEAAITTVTGTLTTTEDKVYFLAEQAAGSADSDTAVASAINAAATWTSKAATANIIVVDTNSTAIYQWNDTTASASGATTKELKLMATVNAVTAVGDYSFVSPVPDVTAPTAPTVALSSSAGADNTFKANDTITATATFNEAVVVTGTPTLEIDVGGVAKSATYTSGIGTTALTFSYPVASGDTDNNGISITANKLVLAGGTIKDAAGNLATITHTAVTTDANRLVDTTAPTATSVSGTPDAASNLVFTFGEVVDIAVVAPLFTGNTAFGASGTPASVAWTVGNTVATVTLGTGETINTGAIHLLGVADVAGNIAADLTFTLA